MTEGTDQPVNISTVDTDAVLRAADLLDVASATRRPSAPIRALFAPDDLASAYSVQAELTARRLRSGARVVGRKIGLTSPAVQAQLGVDQPDFGVLFADMDVSALAEVPSGRLLQPKAEAEVAFVLGEDLVEGDLGPEQIRAAVAYAVAALEIVDSRIANWDITITDTVADNASSGLFVLAETRLTLAEFEPREVRMRMSVDGVEVSGGTGAACLGDPLNALAWLARTARDYGDPLRAGQVILSGALGPMAPTPAGSHVEAVIEPFGSVTATFSGKESS
ncbi:2-keto-4-pentenoate hydratase [Nocardia alba]|uniref:2-keto-4-pentenoate hydratase n=1 Tax=Nocardia alba TaxID=225051 RepID=A0A4R1FVN7_9NOCA|nr:fumarylacetoacetate hydrolase family protein [Nocardia alba]TCJ96658.1 2-keto-4-pentenoate hydratase [Nocardia alba]